MPAGSGMSCLVSWNVCVMNDIVGMPPPTLADRASTSFCTMTCVCPTAKLPESDSFEVPGEIEKMLKLRLVSDGKNVSVTLATPLPPSTDGLPVSEAPVRVLVLSFPSR